jgi:hypothetical protein
MKAFTVLFSLFSVLALAQTDSLSQEIDCEKVFALAEELPKYPSGDEAWMAEVKSKIASLSCVSAKATHLRVIINAEGEMTKPKLHPTDVRQCEKEIVSLLKTFSRAEPAKQRGHPICITVVFPLREK